MEPSPDNIILSDPLEGEMSLEKLKEKVIFLAEQISTWSKRMDIENYTYLLEYDRDINEEEDRLETLVFKALLEPVGQKLMDPVDVKWLKNLLDSFDGDVDSYLRKAKLGGIDGLLLIDRLQALAKKLSSWNDDD